MYAVLGNYPECVSILLDNGAQLGLTDTSGRGALHWAAHHGRGRRRSGEERAHG